MIQATLKPLMWFTSLADNLLRKICPHRPPKGDFKININRGSTCPKPTFFSFRFPLVHFSHGPSLRVHWSRQLICVLKSPTLVQTNMEAPRTPLEDLVPFTEAFWELPCLSEGV